MQNFVYFVVGVLCVLVPLVFSPKSSELFEFPKLLLIYFGASMLAPLLFFRYQKIMRWLKQKNNRFGRWILSALIVFLASQILSALFSIDQHTSFFGYYSRFNGGLLSLLSYFSISLAVAFFFNSEKVIKLLKTILFGGTIVALISLPSHFGYDFICLLVTGKFDTNCWTNDFVPQLRMFGTLGQPNWLATYLLVLIFISLFFLLTKKLRLGKTSSQYNSLFLAILFLLFSLELIWTNSRSGMLAYFLFVPLFLLAGYYINKARFRKVIKQSYFLPLIVVFLLFSVQVIVPAANKLRNYLSAPKITEETSISKNDNNNQVTSSGVTPSSQIRLIVWQGALKLAEKYPLFGSGVETFAYGYNFTRLAKHNLTSEWNYVYNKAHNEFLNYLATTGLVGLASYLLMCTAFLAPGLWLVFSRKTKLPAEESEKEFALFYVITLSAIMLMNFFGFATTATNLFFYLLPALILAYYYNPISSNKSPTAAKSLSGELSFTKLCFYFGWLFLAFIYLLNYFFADYHYARAKEYKYAQDFTNAYIYGQKALDLRREPVYLDQQALVAANLSALQKIQRNSPQAKKFADLAIEYNNLAIDASPKNPANYKTSAKVYYVLSMSYIDNESVARTYLNKAISALEKGAKLAPTDPVIPYTHASLVHPTDTDLAQELLRRSLELKPNYHEAKEMLYQLQKK